VKSSNGPSWLAQNAGWLVALVAFGVVAIVRPVAAERFQRVKTKSDIYPLPPPEQTVIASLGYRSALADAIFAHVRVAYGIAAGENRRLEFAGEYLDAMNALDPMFRDPYRFADTFLVLTPELPTLEHYQKAREVYLRGIKNRPFDTDLWSSAGQYLAYIAAPQLPTPELKRAFRLEGAKILARACELAGSNDNVPYQCMTAAGLFSDAGQREAAIDAARRLLQVTDDPDIERREIGFLRKKLDEREADRAEHRRTLFRAAWKADLPSVSKNQLLVVGPRVDVAACAGLEHAEDGECAPTWKSWARHVDPAQEE
jgi:tetratricopeptide (TPR) repeat protein